MHPLDCDIRFRFEMPERRMRVNIPILPILPLKYWLPWQRPLSDRKQENQINNVRSQPTIWWKYVRNYESSCSIQLYFMRLSLLADGFISFCVNNGMLDNILCTAACSVL